jgi:hypothetical protein
MELQCWWAFDPEMHSPFQINLNSWFELEFIKCQQFFFFFVLVLKVKLIQNFGKNPPPSFFSLKNKYPKISTHLFIYLFILQCLFPIGLSTSYAFE